MQNIYAVVEYLFASRYVAFVCLMATHVGIRNTVRVGNQEAATTARRWHIYLVTSQLQPVYAPNSSCWVRLNTQPVLRERIVLECHISKWEAVVATDWIAAWAQVPAFNAGATAIVWPTVDKVHTTCCNDYVAHLKLGYIELVIRPLMVSVDPCDDIIARSPVCE